MVVIIQIAEFKLHQYQWRAISPNLMLAKTTHYNNNMVHGNMYVCGMERILQS